MMIKKIQRKQFLIDNLDFPQSNYRTDKHTYPENYNYYIFTLNSKSAKGHARLLSIELSKLLKSMDFDKFRFLGDTNIPWLFRDHDYKPVVNAQMYLKENKIGKTFSGALEVDAISFPEFIKHLYWQVRCNGIVNYIYFSDVNNNILVNICQYGSVHFSTLNAAIDAEFEKEIAKTKFKFVTEGSCNDPFSKFNKIPNRRIVGS
jgi:hypothetical protein